MDNKNIALAKQEGRTVSGTESVSMAESLGSAIRIADERLAQATSADEVVLAARIRAEIIRQNLDVGKHFVNIRQAEERIAFKRRQQILDAGLRFGALAAGGVLVAFGNSWLGGFVMAAGLYAIARDFVMEKFPSPGLGRRGSNED